MVHDLRLGGEFFSLLEELDAKIARQVAMAGCRHCAGPLHQANYPRKPRGGEIAGAAEAFTLRHSLCCGEDPVRAQAAIDRFTSNAYDLVIEGESYRSRQKPTLRQRSKTSPKDPR